MSKAKEAIQELFAQETTKAQWFALNENQSQEAIKRTIKLLRGLNRSSKITIEEIDSLTAKDITEIASNAPKQSGTAPQVPRTSAEFFHSTMPKSPYLSEIIPVSGMHHKTMPSGRPTFSSSVRTGTHTDSNNRGTETIHGFHLNEGEAFSSTRYFSSDKKSFATITAKDGTFEARHQNLNSEQEADMVFEMAFQFLLNLPPERKTISLNGTPEMVHKLRAAFFQLQKESGARYADLDFKLPEGMSISSDALNDAYIKQYLGTPKETPQQIIQWRQFLTLPSATPEKTHDVSANPPTQEEKKPLIDMERVFHAPDLSQEDKLVLNEYQHYLQETWEHSVIDARTQPGPHIEAHQVFMQRTEEAMRVLHKTPSLQKEYDALTKLYIDIGESHYKMLDELYQNDLDYEKKMNGLLPDLQKALVGAIQDCLHATTQRLELYEQNAPLTEEQQKELVLHAQAMQEVAQLVEGKDLLPGDMARSCCAQLSHAMNFLASVSECSKEPLFQQMRQFAKEQAEKKDSVKKTSPEHMAQAAQQVKERLAQFKKEFQQSEAANIPVTPQMKKQLEALDKKLDRFMNSIEIDTDKKSIRQLRSTIKKISESTSLTKAQLDSLNQSIERVLPLTKEQPGLTKALIDAQKLAKTEPASLVSPTEERHHDQQRSDSSGLAL